MRQRLDPLTSLRFVAALAVLVHHLSPWYFQGIVSTWPGQIVTFECFSGVTLFFILSGFILFYNYEEKLRHPSWTTIKDFYVARFARIYPVFLLSFFFI